VQHSVYLAAFWPHDEAIGHRDGWWRAAWLDSRPGRRDRRCQQRPGGGPADVVRGHRRRALRQGGVPALRAGVPVECGHSQYPRCSSTPRPTSSASRARLARRKPRKRCLPPPTTSSGCRPHTRPSCPCPSSRQEPSAAPSAQPDADMCSEHDRRAINVQLTRVSGGQ
jgi:hypothetical protein